MSKTRLLPAALCAALLLAGCDTRPPAGQAASITTDGGLRYGRLAFEPCALSVPGLDAVEAQCTTLEVPENHAEPDGRRIELAIAWIPARGEGEPDPIFMIAGGPGQSALESYPMLHGAFADARRNRHVLLVDARGTGGSHPLSCKDEEGENAFIDEDEPTPEAARAFAERCLDQLDDDSDLRFYTTTDHIQDLDLVRELVGASAPTRSTSSACPTARASPSSTPGATRSTRARSRSIRWCPTTWRSGASTRATSRTH